MAPDGFVAGTAGKGSQAEIGAGPGGAWSTPLYSYASHYCLPIWPRLNAANGNSKGG